MTCRIHRPVTPEAVVFESSSAVDRAAVRFLRSAEAAGMRLINWPGYVRSWIAAERD